jgi:hypothetical protein
MPHYNIHTNTFLDSQKKGLLTLSEFRYKEAPALFSEDKSKVLEDKPKRPMELDDVKHLVEWKLCVHQTTIGKT